MYRSERKAGAIYIAERSPKGYHKLLWSRLLGDDVDDLQPIDASEVPTKIRHQAYRTLSRQRRIGLP